MNDGWNEGDGFSRGTALAPEVRFSRSRGAISRHRVPKGRLNFSLVQIRFEKRFGLATNLYATVALSFVIPSEAEGPAVRLHPKQRPSQ